MRNLIVLLLTIAPVTVLSQNPLDRIANSLEGIESTQSTEALKREYDRMYRDGANAMNQQQLQAAILNLQQQNIILSKQLADAQQKNQVNQSWFEKLRSSLNMGDAAAVSVQLSEFSKAFVRRRVDMQVDIKSR